MATKTIKLNEHRTIEVTPMTIIHMQESISQYTMSDGTEVQIRVPLRRAYKVLKVIDNGVEQNLNESDGPGVWVEMGQAIVTADGA